MSTADPPIPSATERPRSRVVFVQGWVRQYRAPFYEQLRRRLQDEGVLVDLVHGTPSGIDGSRRDTVFVPWAYHVQQRAIRISDRRLGWQPCLEHLRGADLIIVEQAAKHLLNYLLLARQAGGGTPVAFWGHGRNFQAGRRHALSEAVKKVVSRLPHWWFAYNELSAHVVRSIGFPPERITVVGNTIDTRALAAARDDVGQEEVAAVRDELGLDTDNVGVYCGSMYPDKRLPLLLEAAEEIRAAVPDFVLLCLGDGVDRHLVDEAAARHHWIRYVGPRFGRDLVPYFALAKVSLMPGLVGLAVLDSFVLETPLVTTAEAPHSPEITYLQHGRNGVVVPGDGSDGAFAAAVVELLRDDEKRARIEAGCREGARHYSIEAMADRFADGILQALAVARGAPVAA